jgi:UDP-N-acetylmuramate dehydrogenase
MNLKWVEEVAVAWSNWKLLIRAMAWENWHDFVRYTLDKWWYGFENLSLIPGTVWASPIQNIGAYWVEVGEHIKSVEWLDFDTGNIRAFTRRECNFWYRESIFKSELKWKWIVVSVTFCLNSVPNLKLEYGAIGTELTRLEITTPVPKDVSDVVISIRQSKLPNPEEIWNAGSFFKNPYICLEHFNYLKSIYPTIPSYPTENPEVFKIAAGWLIEQAGWKWKRIGDAGVHDKQALVLVNHKNATGEDILNLSKNIIENVMSKYSVRLEWEVSIVGNSIDKI